MFKHGLPVWLPGVGIKEEVEGTSDGEDEERSWGRGCTYLPKNPGGIDR